MRKDGEEEKKNNIRKEMMEGRNKGKGEGDEVN